MKSHNPTVTALLMAVIIASGGRVAVAQPAVSEGSRERFHYDAKGRRDPFVALVRDGKKVVTSTTRAAGPGPVLRGVLWDPDGRSIAMINEGEYRVGDMVGEFRILEIRKEAVVLANGEEPLVIQIDFGSAKRAPAAATGGGEP